MEQPQRHLRITRGAMPRCCLIPGDPARAERIAQRFERAEEVIRNREFLGFRGTVEGVPIGVCSTGIGGQGESRGPEGCRAETPRPDLSPHAHTYPRRVVHADWSVGPKKRRVATAVLDHRRYRAEAPTGWTDELLGLAEPAPGGTVIGFDFPIGVPIAYARNLGIKTFRDLLERIAVGRLPAFGDPARTPEEISLERPFYPQERGGCKKEHLLRGLRVPSPVDLLRQCERPHPGRGAAECMFWTLGRKQVGKALLCGWRDVLIPCLNDPRVALWPFDGGFETLIGSRRVVIVETYPAEYYRPLGLTKVRKRNQDSRRDSGRTLLKDAWTWQIECSPGLEAQLRDGFGAGEGAEDDFDAVVGLFGMIKAIAEGRTDAPAEASIRDVEGWIFGQDKPCASRGEAVLKAAR